MIKRIVNGPIQENGYIISNNGLAIIVDPGSEASLFIHYLNENKLKLEAILITHGHHDHIGAVEEIVKQTNCRIYCHKDTETYLYDNHYSLASYVQFNSQIPLIYVDDTIHEINYEIKAYHTPGHAKGSLMYYIKDENAMFTGDTLFKGSIGRYDLPGSSIPETLKSIDLIKMLDFDCIIYPGHGEISTLKHEQDKNPYLRESN